MTDSPEQIAQWVTDQAETWKRADDLLGGTDKMRAAAERHLPRFEGEPDPNYKTRLNSTVLTNFYRSMARDIEGVMTASKITIADSKLPPEFLDNVDRQGRDIHAFAAEQIFALLTKGAFHILTDYPKDPGVQTLAEKVQAGLRPYWTVVGAPSVIDAITAVDAGVERITHVRWMEKSAVRDGFGRVALDTIRILQIADKDRDGGAGGAKAGQVEYIVYQRKGTEKFVITDGPRPLTTEGNKPLTEITLAPVLADRRNDWVSIPPLDDVAHKNIEHWASSSDQRNILRVSRFPMLVQIGTAAPIKITGPGMTLHSSGKTSSEAQDVKFEYIEPEGNGIEHGEKDLARIQAEAEMIGVRLMAKPSQRTRADAESDAAKDQSPLQQLAKKLEDALTNALRHAAIWYGKAPEDGGKAVVPRDFGLSADDAKAIEALLKMRATGDISQLTLWAEMRARGYLKTAFEDKEEQERIKDEQATQGMEGADPFDGPKTEVDPDADPDADPDKPQGG